MYDVIAICSRAAAPRGCIVALVRDKKIAVNASGFSGFPGEKYPNLFAFFAVPARGHMPPAEIEDAMQAEINRLDQRKT